MSTVLTYAAWYIAFLFSTTLHEAAHAWAAKLGGDLTAYHGGQVTLDPIPHIRRQPFGMVLLPIISLFIIRWPFGFASAPYDPRWAARYPKRAALMAIAGPLANLALVVLAGTLIRVGLLTGILGIPAGISFTTVATSVAESGLATGVALLLSVFFTLNLILALLNIVPLPPLDGSALPLLWLSHEGVVRYQNVMAQPAFGFLGLFLAWQIFPALFDPVFTFAINLVYPGVSYGAQ